MGNCIRCALFPPGGKCRKVKSEGSSVAATTAAAAATTVEIAHPPPPPPNSPPSSPESLADNNSPNLKYFTYQSLQASTMNFHPSRLIGIGYSGSVFKGWVHPTTQSAVRAGDGVPIAVKMFESTDSRNHREWLSRVSKASEMRNQSIAKVLGYCINEETRFIVCSYMQIGSLASVLFDERYETLSWESRGKIALDVACALKYLHESEPQVVYGELKSTSVLLNYDHTAKLSGFGLVKAVDGEGDDEVENTLPGYAAPEYIETGMMTPECDIYSYGVVLLELLSGRPSIIEATKYEDEVELVGFAQPLARNTRLLNRFMDPRLKRNYPQRDAYLAILLGLQCTGEPRLRPNPNEIIRTIQQIFSPHRHHHHPRHPFSSTSPSQSSTSTNPQTPLPHPVSP